MSKKITLTLPDITVAALAKKGAPYELDAGDYLKQHLLASSQGYNVPLMLKDAIDQVNAQASEPVLEQSELLGGAEGGGK